MYGNYKFIYRKNVAFYGIRTCDFFTDRSIAG